MKKLFSRISSDTANYALDFLENTLLTGKISRRQFIGLAVAAGLTHTAAVQAATKAVQVRENQLKNARQLKKNYDYIVCGAGSSGCVVAARLAADPSASVLLVEAGGDDDAASIGNPGVWFTNMGTQTDWRYVSEPATGLNGRTIIMPMGHAIGGGSSINAMIYARGHRSDFDGWARDANDPKWGYDHVLSIYKRVENWQGSSDPLRRGRGGPLWVQNIENPSPVALGMLRGAASIGIPTFEDMNGELMDGDGGSAMPNLIVKNGQRHSVAKAYLYPVLDQPNITVLTRAFVRRVVLEGNQATGVEFSWKGGVRTISANREVVLSLGGINSPKVLMLSGIGDSDVLRSAGVKARHVLHGVGKNFQDHPLVEGCVWEYKEPIAPHNNAAEATLFWKSDPKLDVFDLQPFLIELPVVSRKVREQYATPTAGFTIAPGLVHPKSRGYVSITSADPEVKPYIQTNMLDHPDDVEALLKCADLVREIGNSAAMANLVKREIVPGNLGRKDMADFIRNGANSYGHETCTCKMGTDDMSVVDSKLQVHGIKNLRVADGSIMPTITRGNTMAPCIVIGERMSEILGA